MKAKKSQKKEDIFCKILIRSGFNFASGVPCGVLKYIIIHFKKNSKIKHVPANRESEVLGIAAGAYLAGKNPVVYMQNSGLMNSLNDINSLLIPYKIPVLFLVSWRGTWGEDAPQHLINGRNTLKILKTTDLLVQILNKNNLQEVVRKSQKWLKKTKKPSIILIKRNALK